MAIAFSCPKCGQKYTVHDDNAGSKLECRGCGQKLLVPEPKPRPKPNLHAKTVLGDIEEPQEPLPQPATPSSTDIEQEPESKAEPPRRRKRRTQELDARSDRPKRTEKRTGKLNVVKLLMLISTCLWVVAMGVMFMLPLILDDSRVVGDHVITRDGQLASRDGYRMGQVMGSCCSASLPTIPYGIVMIVLGVVHFSTKPD